ncbi:MAG: hypothetical protein CVV62_01405 [Tenericutes bacterium HGW-Tenericutes-7]|nr:MAG: hypothetical protein CVV62_01405 [Tenericutes bacterium HGW-Tenericutes-7]PKK96593.1 MAG: hypothetical protein CVV58_05560 [Tenericutes bacterium HGW-Tenericutes-3]
MKVIVSDITCNHCVMTVQKALLMKGIAAKVELSDKSVTFKNEKDLEKVIETIKEAGYTPEV